MIVSSECVGGVVTPPYIGISEQIDKPQFTPPEGLIRRGDVLCQGEDDGDLEQVAVHHQVHLALLQLHEALGDVQP